MAIASRPVKHEHTVHSKKRYGLHQKHTKRFKDAYWPYLPLLVVVGLGMVVSSAWSNSKSVLGVATNMSPAQLLAETNTDRSQHNIPTVTLNSQLSAAAQAKADDMVKRDYWSHNTPDGRTPWTFITKAGYDYQRAGENLAYGFANAGATNTAWMHSPEHRANILDKYYTNVGFGIANAKDYQGAGAQTVVVEMFGQPAPANVQLASSHYTAQPLTNTSAAPASTAQSLPKLQSVSRIQLLAPGSASWSLLAVSAIATLAALWFVLKHGFLWRRAFVYGETFIVHHRLLDVLVAVVAVAGFVLSRSAGIIG